MTTIEDTRERHRPLWLPHPALLAAIAGLWALAAVAQSTSWPGL